MISIWLVLTFLTQAILSISGKSNTLIPTALTGQLLKFWLILQMRSCTRSGALSTVITRLHTALQLCLMGQAGHRSFRRNLQFPQMHQDLIRFLFRCSIRTFMSRSSKTSWLFLTWRNTQSSISIQVQMNTWSGIPIHLIMANHLQFKGTESTSLWMLMMESLVSKRD